MGRAAFQGEVGAFSEEAAGLLLPSLEPWPYPTFEAVFEALVSGEVVGAVVPIENTLFGSVHVNYDLLREHDVHIVGEIFLRIRHNLLVIPGTGWEDIRFVISHPQALGQCKSFLKEKLPGAEQVSAYDTAGAAKRLAAEQRSDSAAIASLKAADMYRLDVLASNIESNHQNYTRFLALSGRKPDVAPTDTTSGDLRRSDFRTSIVYALGDTVPGTLFRTLAVFADRDIDLLKIESRPLIGTPGSYLFYLDLDGGVANRDVEEALSNLRRMADFVKVLGSYPRGAWADGSQMSAGPH